MAKKKSSKKPVIISQLQDWAVQRLGKIAWFVGTITVLGTGYLTYIKVADAVEPVIPLTSHGYVREQITKAMEPFKVSQNETVKILRDLQIETAEGKRDAAATAIDKFSLDLGKAQNDEERLRINKSIRDLSYTKDKLDAQIKTLNKLKDR